jgi:hypothetical protein
VIDLIRSVRPDASITFDDTPLAFPEDFDGSKLKQHLRVYETPLEEGIRQTIEHFEICLHDGRIQIRSV